MPQYARPISDVSAGGWTTNSGSATNLFAAIDEDPANDADFIQCSATVNDSCKIKLSTVEAALIKRGHIVRYRGQKGTAGGNTRGVTVSLVKGLGAQEVTIASNAHPDMVTVPLDGAFLLTPAQAATITDYNDLYVKFTASGNVSAPAGNRRRVQISWLRMRVPEATFGAVLDTSEPGVFKYTLNGVTGEGPSREDALVDLFDKLREINGAIEEPDANQLAERALLGNRWAYLYYARKIRDYTELRADIADGSYVLPPHQNIPEELINIDEKLARFDAITNAADAQDGG